ncbi:hypothetical protein Sjap_003594 [Stephania japonica]|uniref:F-box domain-containing protein n=1 Tax=Stephania japonica TaxID=461633 RepID=A0AAP0PVM0_9MAGN
MEESTNISHVSSEAIEEEKNKKKRRSQYGISDLPDSILHHIFSFLNIQHAVRASVLSKRFRNLWKSLSYLNFVTSADDEQPTHYEDFVIMVNKVLILRGKSDIVRLRVHFENEDIAPHIESWISAAIQYNVREVDLTVHALHDLPTSLFFSKSLKVLRLSLTDCVGMFTFPSLGPPMLEVLILKFCTLAWADNISGFISACSSLKDLVLQDVELGSETTYHIKNGNLKRFVIKDEIMFANEPHCIFQINAPNLTAFTCSIEMQTEILFAPLPLLNFADIELEVKTDLTEDEKQRYLWQITRLLNAVRNVKSLKLSADVFDQVAFEPRVVPDCRSMQFHNLTYLSFRTSLSRDCIFTIVELLKISPKIKTLVIHVAEENLTSGNMGECLELGCMLHHLKVLKIHGVIGCINEIKLLQLVLEKAIVLEKMLIWTAKYDMPPHREKRLESFRKTLSTVPRVSSNATISFF